MKYLKENLDYLNQKKRITELKYKREKSILYNVSIKNTPFQLLKKNEMFIISYTNNYSFPENPKEILCKFIIEINFKYEEI